MKTFIMRAPACARVMALAYAGLAWLPSSAVRAEPQYMDLHCDGGQHTDLDAQAYLDLYGAHDDDRRLCPPMDWFVASSGWRPKLAWDETIADDYGWVAVQPPDSPGADGCTAIPDTTASYDFTLACQAHDYCYSLRAAGFHETVTDEACDQLFFQLMEAHCNNRAFIHQAACREARDVAFAAVRAPFVNTPPNPPVLRFRRAGPPGKCADVTWGSLQPGIRLIQFTCSDSTSQWFQPWQLADGSFRLQRKGTSDRCLSYAGDAVGGEILQDDCANPSRGGSGNTWWIREFFGTNEFVITPTRLLGGRDTCITAPASESSGDYEWVTDEWCEFLGNRFWLLDVGR